jgi:hypothetical protein
MGAVTVKNSVSAVPDKPLFKKSIIDVANEVISSGGEAIVTEGEFIFGLSTDSLTQSYNAQIDAEYKALAQEIQSTTQSVPSKPSPSELMRWEHKRTKFHSRMNDLEQRLISAVDGKDICQNKLRTFEKKLKGSVANKVSSGKLKAPKGAIWVTRKNLHVDRLASAWLIKKHIDPKAQFLFVDMDHYKHKPEHLRFDVFNGEYTHVDDRCTFEVLVQTFNIRSPSIRALAEVIHDLDIEDHKFDRKETEGIRMALDGVIRAYRNDEERLQMAMNLFDSLLLSLK